MPAEGCFPFRLETVDVLNAALDANSSDAKAHYYLGNLLFDIQQEKAIQHWEKSRSLDSQFARVHRNLGWANFRVKGNIDEAIDCYENAIDCEPDDPRLFFELDTLYELGNVEVTRRLAMLQKHHATVARRNPSFLREIMVLVLVGRYDDAINHLSNNFFHVREGGGEIHDVYVDAHLLKGLDLMKQKQFEQALQHFDQASEYPENLSVGRPKNDPRAPQVAFCIGSACESLDQREKAIGFYKEGADREGRTRSPQTRFYRALCLGKLGESDEARRIFDDLIEDGRKRLTEAESPDFVAKFGEEETPEARKAQGHFAVGLGLLGKGNREEAKAQFRQAVKLNRSHVWAKYHLAQLE
jgi:tetratricopeptide (TPR) repeat protein